MKDFNIVGDVPPGEKPSQGKRKWKYHYNPETPGVKLSHIASITTFGKRFASVVLKNGSKARVKKELAMQFVMRSPSARKKFLPATFEKYPYDETVLPEEIKNVQFRYALVSLVTLFSSQIRFVPRAVSDAFDSNTEDFLLRGTDQPWNDLRTFDIEYSDIVSIIRKNKKTARVLTTSGSAVRITRERADKFEEWKKSGGQDKLASEAGLFLFE